jgi:cytochrome c oxidase subunit I
MNNQTTSAIMNPPINKAGDLGVKLYLGTALVVLLLMMLAGLAMKAGHAGWFTLPSDIFYQIMTVHGVGMVGLAGLAGAGVMWYFLQRHVDLNVEFLYVNYVLFLLGVVCILSAIFLGGYAGGWTFLWPLPAKSMGLWSAHAAAGFIVGLILIGTGFLLFYFDAARAITQRYGSILKGLGVDQLIAGKIDTSHPPTVVASSMVIIVNTLGTLTGAVILVITLINLYVPEFVIDALIAKNMIYFFGHVFINASIYMAVIAVYEILPLYVGRPWKTSRPFYMAWVAATVFVMAVYPHHLLLDSVMPAWMLVMGQIISYLSGIPVLLVTTWGAWTLIYKADVKWQAPARWLIVATLGWSLGVIPAIVDGTLSVNKVMHNTLWVPGHFHLYLLGGLLPMWLGFALHVYGASGSRNEQAHLMWVRAYALGVVLLCGSFLLGGWAGVPRRFADHLPSWQGLDQWGAWGGVLVLAMSVWLVTGIVRSLFKPAST